MDGGETSSAVGALLEPKTRLGAGVGRRLQLIEAADGVLVAVEDLEPMPVLDAIGPLPT